eukprot:1184051-Prorocentrum_minimum.AAC.1
MHRHASGHSRGKKRKTPSSDGRSVPRRMVRCGAPIGNPLLGGRRTGFQQAGDDLCLSQGGGGMQGGGLGVVHGLERHLLAKQVLHYGKLAVEGSAAAHRKLEDGHAQPVALVPPIQAGTCRAQNIPHVRIVTCFTREESGTWEKAGIELDTGRESERRGWVSSLWVSGVLCARLPLLAQEEPKKQMRWY